jgi:hypothetical protein
MTNINQQYPTKIADITNKVVEGDSWDSNWGDIWMNFALGHCPMGSSWGVN